MAWSFVHEGRPKRQGHEQGEEDRNVRGMWVFRLGVERAAGLQRTRLLGTVQLIRPFM